MSYDPTINDLVNKALLLWADIFNIDLEGKSWSATLGEWQLRRHAEELSVSRDLDPTGLTTFMMLKVLLERQLNNLTIKGIDFLRNYEQVQKDMAPLDDLLTLLEREEIVEMVEDFQEQLKEAAAHYGADMEKVAPYIDDLWNAAYVRRNALRSMETLEAHQFVQGEPQSDTLTFNSKVYEFWNINSLIRAMRAQLVPGITLCLIRDPMALHSYFVFAIKNGENITILTDRPNSAHPMQKRMSRRPDRELSSRVEKHHFPYELLDVEISEDQKHLWAKARTAIVPTDTNAVPLANVKDLAADTIVWLTMVFDRIRQRYGVENHQCPELSYTGEMVADPHSLVGARGELVLSGQYKPLDLGTIEHDEMKGEIENNWNRESTGFNQWMVDRYGDQVPEDAFNLVGDQAKQKLLPEIEKGVLAPKAEDLEKYERNRKIFGDNSNLTRNPHLSLEALDPMGFGSKEDLQKDRMWTARYNQAKTIQRLADVEYEAERQKIIDWYTKRVKKNEDALINAVCQGELILPNNTFRRFAEGERPEEVNALRRIYNRLGHPRESGWWDTFMGWTKEGDVQIMGGEQSPTGHWECAITGAKATIFGQVEPTCPEALAILCGCEVADLPLFLQHWYSRAPYNGNSILDRLDPVDCFLKNPWIKDRSRGVHLRVGVALSKSGFNRRRKELGLSRIKVEELDRE